MVPPPWLPATFNPIGLYSLYQPVHHRLLLSTLYNLVKLLHRADCDFNWVAIYGLPTNVINVVYCLKLDHQTCYDTVSLHWPVSLLVRRCIIQDTQIAKISSSIVSQMHFPHCSFCGCYGYIVGHGDLKKWNLHAIQWQQHGEEGVARGCCRARVKNNGGGRGSHSLSESLFPLSRFHILLCHFKAFLDAAAMGKLFSKLTVYWRTEDELWGSSRNDLRYMWQSEPRWLLPSVLSVAKFIWCKVMHTGYPLPESANSNCYMVDWFLYTDASSSLCLCINSQPLHLHQ